MRLSRMLVTLGALVAAVALTTSAGAVTQSTAKPTQGAHMKRLDLSSMPKIKSYLRSIGVNPRTVVIQRGDRNYAGPNCPGKGWTCTTQTQRRVLQVGSQNASDCTQDTCTGLTQSGPQNSFSCSMRTSDNSALQECDVTQFGVRNFARFEQVIDQSTMMDPTQTATQIVRVYQQADPGLGGPPKNELHVYQRITQSITTPTDQKQDAHQFVAPFTGNFNLQVASGGGNNYYDVHQYINDKASGGATSQMQNTGGVPAETPEQCTAASPLLGPTEPNQCLVGNQRADTSGFNEAHLHELIDEDAKTSNPNADQQQGQPNGGSGGDIHQNVSSGDFSLGASVGSTGTTGRSESHADQARRQNASGGDSQIQIDPGRCCGISQSGGENNRQDINQNASQKSDAASSDQDLTLIGECNTENGSCLITHHVRNDADHANFNCGSPGDRACGETETTHCDGLRSEGSQSGECVTPPDVVPDLTDGIMTASSLLPGTPLSGFEITMGLVPLP